MSFLDVLLIEKDRGRRPGPFRRRRREVALHTVTHHITQILYPLLDA
jgi:hypothetical protein